MKGIQMKGIQMKGIQKKGIQMKGIQMKGIFYGSMNFKLAIYFLHVISIFLLLIVKQKFLVYTTIS